MCVESLKFEEQKIQIHTTMFTCTQAILEKSTHIITKNLVIFQQALSRKECLKLYVNFH